MSFGRFRRKLRCRLKYGRQGCPHIERHSGRRSAPRVRPEPVPQLRQDIPVTPQRAASRVPPIPPIPPATAPSTASTASSTAAAAAATSAARDRAAMPPAGTHRADPPASA